MSEVNIKKHIVVYEVPCTLTPEKSLKLHEDRKKELSKSPLEITKLSDIQKTATDLSQENSRAMEVAKAFMVEGQESSVNLSYLI